MKMTELTDRMHLTTDKGQDVGPVTNRVGIFFGYIAAIFVGLFCAALIVSVVLMLFYFGYRLCF